MGDRTRWRRPHWMVGDDRLVRIGPGTGGQENHICPERDAAKAHPAVTLRVPSQLPDETLETFTIGPVAEVLDLVEFGGASPDQALGSLAVRKRPLHPAHRAYTEHAVRRYVAREESPGLVPVRPYWVVRRENGLRWELYAWWRRYRSPDGSVREFRRLRHGGARSSTPGEIAIAAYAAAFGTESAWPRRWREEFRPTGRASRPRRVRIVEVGLDDGSSVVQFEGTVEEAKAYYDAHGDPQVRAVIQGGEARPGSACAECKLFTGCAAVPRIPGVLAISAQRAPLREVSASALRYHDVCPAQALLRRLHLPKEDEYTDAAKLGQAVHDWIDRLHRRPGHPPCSVADMPPPGHNWTSGRWQVPDPDAEAGRAMLLHHVDACPFHDSALIEEVESEAVRAVHDTAAQALVISKPDLLYREDGSWVWRELKTTRRTPRPDEDLLDRYPQLALAVTLLAEGALGGDPTGSRVEVEILRPDGAHPHVIDPTDPERLARARSVLRRLAGPWRDDRSWAARPGNHCRQCPVSRWCPDSATADTARAISTVPAEEGAA
ncbi:PD-(D/E)XK nuclease family protein [Kitasatospora sp. NPDC093806]|uniref:PD-(D/E)XK nuclease family protein n=1 Tax=Kitasatospora sp. NPDC093806 TaxID=3155075 RepID=UPI00344313A6